MQRRQFLKASGATALGVLGLYVAGAGTMRSAWAALGTPDLTAAEYKASRRYAALSMGKIAYIERGHGPAAIFLHGIPLNSFQWRGAIARLSPYRRCVAPDWMGLGYTEVPAAQPLDAHAQMAMIVALMDSLHIDKADFVASDSGTGVAQLLAVNHPQRVRSLLLTNGDVEGDSPPAGAQPAIELARAGKLADATEAWLGDTAMAQATFGKAVYHNPSVLTSEHIAYYVSPVVSSELRRKQYHDIHLAMEPNPLAGIESKLKQSHVPMRVLWGGEDTVFAQTDAEYLDRTFPQSKGVRRLAEGKLFFQEEYPDVIAEEARKLWGV